MSSFINRTEVAQAKPAAAQRRNARTITHAKPRDGDDGVRRTAASHGRLAEEASQNSNFDVEAFIYVQDGFAAEVVKAVAWPDHQLLPWLAQCRRRCAEHQAVATAAGGPRVRIVHAAQLFDVLRQLPERLKRPDKLRRWILGDGNGTYDSPKLVMALLQLGADPAVAHVRIDADVDAPASALVSILEAWARVVAA